MKSILILLLMAFSNTILATGAERENKSYRFIGYGKIFEFDTNKSIDIVNNGDKITGSIVYFEMSDPGDYVEYVDTRTLDNQTFIVFSFWKYDVKATADYRKYNINDDNEQLFFLMKEEDFDQKTIEVPSHLQFSAITIPIKLRPHPFTFAENTNIGAALIYQPRANRLRSMDLQSGASFALGTSLTNVTLDSLSTRGDVLGSSVGRAFSLYGGLIYSKATINFSLLFGADWVAASDTKRWTYQGDMWIGLGFGVQLSALTSATPGNN